MTFLIIGAVVWAICKVLSIAAETRKRAERERDRKQAAWNKEQERINREQARINRDAYRERKELAKEQARQAKELERHDAEIAKMKLTLAQAIADIDYLKQRIIDLDAQTDNLLYLQSQVKPGTKEWDRLQGKIVVLRNQVHTAETRLRKAEFAKEQAEMVA